MKIELKPSIYKKSKLNWSRKPILKTNQNQTEIESKNSNKIKI